MIIIIICTQTKARQLLLLNNTTSLNYIFQSKMVLGRWLGTLVTVLRKTNPDNMA